MNAFEIYVKDALISLQIRKINYYREKQNFLQELLNNEQTKSVEENEKGESESEDESIEESVDGEHIETSEDSESEDEEVKGLNNTNQTGGGIFSILLPILASTVLPALLKK